MVLAIGVLAGFVTQLVAARMRYVGEEWTAMLAGRKVAMGLTGALASLVTGLYILDHPPAGLEEAPFWRHMIMWQIIAAWAGSLVLDAGAHVLEIIAKQSRRDETIRGEFRRPGGRRRR